MLPLALSLRSLAPRSLRPISRGWATTVNSADPNFVKIVEVSPRDGLQNEKILVPTAVKLELIKRLEKTGLSVIEAGAFVSPKWVPQMGDTPSLLSQLEPKPSISYPVLVPNSKGLESLLSLLSSRKASSPTSIPPTDEIAIFAAASEAFSKANTNCSISESLERLDKVCSKALSEGLKVRGYVSVIAGCPFSGDVDPKIVADLSKRLLEMGCYEISLGDTVGFGTPSKVLEVLDSCFKVGIDPKVLAAHCHDTFGTGISNVLAMVKEGGVRTVDSSVGGLGGCPYSPGATGNIDTESVIYSLHQEGFQTGVDISKVAEVGAWISEQISRPNGSRAGRAVLAREKLAKEKSERESRSSKL